MTSIVDFHKYNDKLRLKKEGEKHFIWCIIRKKYLVLQPEELVRQLILQAIVEENLFPINLIQVEKGLMVNGLRKRFDIIIYDRGANPFMLVECKSYKLKLAQNAIDQAAMYNRVLEAPYLFLSNGITSVCAAINFKDGSYEILDSLPELK